MLDVPKTLPIDKAAREPKHAVLHPRFGVYLALAAVWQGVHVKWRALSVKAVLAWASNDVKASFRGWKRPDTIAALALIVACVSAYFSYSVSRTAQLNERRSGIRAQATEIINAYQKKLDYFNCYFTSLGKPIDEHNPQLVSLENQLDKMRTNLSSIDTFDNKAMNTFQSYINRIPGKPDRESDKMIREIRAKMSSQQLDRAGKVCTLSG